VNGLSSVHSADAVERGGEGDCSASEMVIAQAAVSTAEG
jgi:hypothetical protein